MTSPEQGIVPPTLDEVHSAAELLAPILVHTPLVPLHSYGRKSTILLKPEIHQCVTSFKIRGVFHAVARMNDENRRRGIGTCSAGNTAQALAWTGQFFGVPATSVMPDSAPRSKIDAVKRYGGTPVLVPMPQVFEFMKQHLWERQPYAFVHPWTDRDVMIGHATIALEIIADCPDVDSVFVPVGGGGLMAGVGTAIKLLRPSVKVFAVEPVGCPSFHNSIAAGRPVSVDSQTICDGVAVPYMTQELFPLLRDVVDKVLLVDDQTVLKMVKQIALGNKMIIEPSAALSTAAALDMKEEERGKSVCLVTGGSIDPEKFVALF